MATKINRRAFLESSVLAASALPLAVSAQDQAKNLAAAKPASLPTEKLEPMPLGKIGNQEFSRLMMGGKM